jgi:hypothetical protein
MDDKIPDYSFNEIDDANFNLCFSGFVDEDRDVYLIHPSPNETQSDRILVSNFEEDNYAVYRLPLSCMGNFLNSSDVTWNDLSIYKNWKQLSVDYSNWAAFSYNEGAPIPVGGGHGGEIWRLTVTESEDNPQKIRNITIIDENTLRIETDYNNYSAGDDNDALDPADYIYFTDVEGMTELNGQQAAIKNISLANYRFDVEIQTDGLSAYTGGGTASRVIPFEYLTKKFNPYSEMDKKVRCGWMYFYVTTSETLLTNADGDTVPCFLDIDVITNDTEENTTPTASYRVDCTNLATEVGVKRWTKIWINQTARFVQFRVRNVQAGAKIQIHAMMPGFQPVGRLI